MGLMDHPPWPDDEYKKLPFEPIVLVRREEWGAELPSGPLEKIVTKPVEDMICSYTETDTCMTREECSKMMRDLQQKHKSEGLSDIRFTYVVGGNTEVYEGRGWDVRSGKHPRVPEFDDKDRYEVAHSGQRGGLPEYMMSAKWWNVMDNAIWDGHVAEYCFPKQDLEDLSFPPPPDLSEEPNLELMENVKRFNARYDHLMTG